MFLYKNLFLIVCWASPFGIGFAQTPISESAYLKGEIEKIIRFDTEINYKSVPGFIVGIIDGDSTYTFSFGKKTNHKKSSPHNENDIFELGSISKIYTAWVVEKLEKENKLNLQQSVNHFLPEPYQNPRLDKLTIYSLVNHQSGLPLRPHMFGARERDSQNPYAYYTTTDLLEFYRDYIPENDGFVYSHTNYALLELVIEKVTGKNFDDVMKEYVFQPLELNNSFIDFPEKKVDFISPGYDKAVNKVKPWVFSSFRASEGVKTSIHDALIFLKSTMNEFETETLNARIESEETINNGFNKHLFIENGWHILHIKGKKVGIHTGRTTGHSCFMGVVKETKTAVVIFSNSWVGTGDLGLQILRLVNQNWKN